MNPIKLPPRIPVWYLLIVILSAGLWFGVVHAQAIGRGRPQATSSTSATTAPAGGPGTCAASDYPFRRAHGAFFGSGQSSNWFWAWGWDRGFREESGATDAAGQGARFWGGAATANDPAEPSRRGAHFADERHAPQFAWCWPGGSSRPGWSFHGQPLQRGS